MHVCDTVHINPSANTMLPVGFVFFVCFFFWRDRFSETSGPPVGPPGAVLTEPV